MIIVYVLTKDKKIQKIELAKGEKLPKNTIWIDLLDPSLEEKKLVETELVDVPDREELDKLELMSPFYKEDNAYYMTVTSIQNADKGYPEGVAIIFILAQNILVTLRYSRPKAFQYFSNRIVRNPQMGSSAEIVLEGLIESLLNSIADILEKTGVEIDQLLIDVFEKPSEMKKKAESKKSRTQKVEDDEPGLYYTNIIKRIGRTGNLISKIRESLVSINRMLIFFGQIDELMQAGRKEQRHRLRNLSRELHSLTEYANFLSQRNSFLLDATLGMINVEQNMIIKVFTVAAAVFLPPTLIASIYGMNFQHMPELEWVMGYPFSLILIVLSAVLPYYYFKRKDWL